MTVEDPPLRIRFATALPTDIPLTVSRLQRGRKDPTQRTFPDGTVWRTMRTSEGPATVRLRTVGEEVEATGWGPGARDALDRAPALLGSDDDLTGFDPRHPILESAHHRFPGLRIGRTGDVLEAAVGAALEQRVQGVEAIAAWSFLLRRLGESAPGPAPDGMRVMPDGRAWLALPEWMWREAGMDHRRRDLIRALARVDASLARLADAASADSGAADADRALRSIPGVGAWTSAEIRQKALGDADAVSVGDFHLASIVGATLGDRPLRHEELLPFLEPWRPHRYRVARLIYALGIEELPRRAPRAPRTGRRD